MGVTGAAAGGGTDAAGVPGNVLGTADWNSPVEHPANAAVIAANAKTRFICPSFATGQFAGMVPVRTRLNKW
jgi:hypothetical protein